MFDVSNPAKPVLLGTSNPGGMQGIYVSGRYVYTTSGTGSSIYVYDVGGEYAQQFEAGGAEVGTLQVDANAQVAGDTSVQGGLSVGQSIQTGGNLSVSGSTFLQGGISIAGGVSGGLTIGNVGTPSAPAVAPIGTTGSTNYSYTVTAVSASGGETTASPAGSTASGNATLNATNYNTISWTPVAGAASYKVYRTVASGTSPTTTGLIATTANTLLWDTGLAASGSAPTVNTTGNFSVTGGNSLFKDATDNTAAFQIQNASGSTILNVDTSNTVITANSDLNVGGTFGNRLFSDNFEAGSMSLWPTSNLSVVTSPVHGGKYAAQMVMSGVSKLATTPIAASPTVYGRAYVYVTSQGANDVNLMYFKTATKGFIVYRAQTTGNICFWNEYLLSSTCSSTPFATGGWHKLELRLTNTSSGTLQVTYDGTMVINTTQDLSASNYAAFGLGDENGTRTATVTFDDVSVDTVQNSTSVSVNVGDSLHVSGSSSFGGNFLLQTTSNSTIAFQIQNAAGNSFFNVDTTTGNITLGTAASGNYISFSAAGGLTAFGTAQHTKTIALNAEYAGAVLDAQSDATCTSASAGFMTSGYDNTNDMGYYNWTGSASAQCYDVVARVTLPSDFNGWSNSTPLTINTYSTDTTNATLNLYVRDTAHTAVSGCNFVSITPGSTNTWTTNTSSCNLSTGTYTAGQTITIRVRMTANASSNVRIGDLSLSYNSKF